MAGTKSGLSTHSGGAVRMHPDCPRACVTSNDASARAPTSRPVMNQPRPEWRRVGLVRSRTRTIRNAPGEHVRASRSMSSSRTRGPPRVRGTDLRTWPVRAARSWTPSTRIGTPLTSKCPIPTGSSAVSRSEPAGRSVTRRIGPAPPWPDRTPPRRPTHPVRGDPGRAAPAGRPESNCGLRVTPREQSVVVVPRGREGHGQLEDGPG
jgi:hypothetical protein